MRICAIFVLTFSLALVTGISHAAAPVNAAMARGDVVRLETSLGDIIVELDSAKAPITVANFKNYVKSGFYDGTIFHRVIKNFMIQGGGFTENMKQKAAQKTIRNEADNKLKNNKYTIAMARTSDPHSASAQFFINAKDNDFLNHRAPSGDGWGYAVFGKVIQGMDVVDRIAMVKTGRKGVHDDVPQEPVFITHALVLQ